MLVIKFPGKVLEIPGHLKWSPCQQTAD